jgi:heme ABC exporter ATP-binding subunit CcmA
MTGDSSFPPPLKLEGIAHRFGRRWILRGLDLQLDPGQVVAMIGANGAGKTTLLRIAATLLRPLRGRGWVGGASLLENSDRVRTMIGILGHSPALYEDLTPVENLRFCLQMQGDPGDRGRILAILDEVGLTDFAHVRVRRFSTGMRRRVAVGRVLASLPHLLLMDEPYASLDPEGVELVNGTIQRVVDEGGGVLLATHDLRSGAGLTDRVVTLDRGLLREGDGRQPAHGRTDSSPTRADSSSPTTRGQLA